MKLIAPNTVLDSQIEVPSSKSISNRLLIIQALAKSGNVTGISTAQDTVILNLLLNEMPKIMDVGHAGTAFRFLTAYLSVTPGTYLLTGSDRMKNRPIRPLVDALKSLGADIQYVENEGFPPLKIRGTSITKSKVAIDASMSSQFVSALMMIGPYLKKGLTLNLEGDLVSTSYIEMTRSLMQDCGVNVLYENKKIEISTSSYCFETFPVEKDWSSISFWFEMVLIGKWKRLLIKDVNENSIQGDAFVKELFGYFGVKSSFDKDGLWLKYEKPNDKLPTRIDLKNTPDLTQPFIVAMAAIGHSITVTGIQHLKFKETDRALALQTELQKFGVVLKVNDSNLILKTGIDASSTVRIKTYQDHRMAMAFAPLALVLDGIQIENPEVVEKSYPDYWNQLQNLGFTIEA